MVEVTKTRQKLLERAASELGFLPSNATLSDEDRETLDNLVDPLFRQLEIDGIVSVDNSDAIKAEYFLPLGVLLACVAAGSFGGASSLLQGSGYATVPELRRAKESELRRLTATRPTHETLRTTYF